MAEPILGQFYDSFYSLFGSFCCQQIAGGATEETACRLPLAPLERR